MWFLIVWLLALAGSVQAQDRIESWTGKTVMIVTPHPDDDVYGCGAAMAMLAKNRNKVIVVIYTNDDKGSFDLEMTSERLARIRKAEQEAACSTLGIPKENIIWLGYPDGELEYAAPRELCGQVARLIRLYRPDALFSIDPGENHERWHKTDHRMAAFNTIDAVRAAEFHLYYPEHLLYEGLKPYKVPVMFYYYALQADANYWVNIDSFLDTKIEAALKHVSQYEPSINKYRSDMDKGVRDALVAYFRGRSQKREGHYVEAFRRATSFNQQ